MTRVLLLTTGGTIASRRGDQGLEPQISARGLLEYMSDLRAHYHIDARDILNLDSSNIQAEEWQTIARAVMENLDAYDGIVITHGTDTMAYTASVLSYMLHDKKARGGSITLVKVPGLGCWRLDKVPVSELETIVMGK